MRTVVTLATLFVLLVCAMPADMLELIGEYDFGLRQRIDREAELGAVIGRTARYVDANNAEDYVFGYTVTIDVSDRGGRPPGGYGSGSDWFVGKGHDTFAPMGPWIVHREFCGDPMQNLRQIC